MGLKEQRSVQEVAAYQLSRARSRATFVMLRRKVVVATIASLAMATVYAGNAGAASADDGRRVGPPDSPRERNQGTAASNGTLPLPDFWPESPLMDVPGKGEVIPDHYIVVFKPGTRGAADLARHITAENGASLKHSYEHALQGFAAALPPSKVDAIRRNPNVESIEPDRVVGTQETQSGVTWGLDRIDQVFLPLNGSYSDGTGGLKVHAYVIDTGIRSTHREFSGRIGNHYDAVTAGGTANDCNGHGTHVAGTLGGTVYGVADKVTLHAVRVLRCDGSGATSSVIAGIDWVRANAVKPAVANMSLGGTASMALDTAVQNAIAAGISFAVAAGNDNADGCSQSPARVPAAITVGATTNTDNRSSFSNYGACLDLFAPGSNITSSWISGDTATHTISGTSMASPHVAGAAALYLSANPSATPAQVRDALVNRASPGRIINPGPGSPNKLLFAGGASTPPTPGNVVENGGFEDGPTGWTQSSSCECQLITTDKPRTGSHSAYLGGYNGATDTIGQAVTVPPNAYLTYYWHQTSNEATAVAYDYLRVQLYDATTGTLIATLREWSNRNARGVWTRDLISLAGVAGYTVRIQFTASTDSSIPTNFFIDDVSVGW